MDSFLDQKQNSEQDDVDDEVVKKKPRKQKCPKKTVNPGTRLILVNFSKSEFYYTICIWL